MKSGAGIGAVDGMISGLGYSDELENSGGDIAAGARIGRRYWRGCCLVLVHGVTKVIKGQTAR